MNVFITGISSGIGQALAQLYIQKGYKVFGISRRELSYSHENLYHICLDLHDFNQIQNMLDEFLPNKLELAILNAGKLGDIKHLKQTSIDEIKAVMDINVWANKLIMDIVIQKDIKQIIAISSGASVNGSKGWSSYSLSKATLNMLVKLYAHETNAHIIALAPGLIKTPMLDYITSTIDPIEFPSVKRLQESPKLTPKQSAAQIVEIAPKLLQYESGSFLDIRKMS